MRDARSMSRRAQYGRHTATRRAARDAAIAATLVERLAELRAAVARHAADRRAEGARLDQVLVEIADLVELAERLEAAPDELGVLLGQVRLWSLAAYVDEPELRDVPRFY